MKVCDACGNTNPDLNRFCGKCGAALSSSLDFDSAAPADPSRPASISGPSLLGLDASAQEQDDITYLLEEEPHRRHIWLFLLLVILLLGPIAFIAYRVFYLTPTFTGPTTSTTLPSFAYQRTPASVWKDIQNPSVALEPVLPNTAMRDRLALENIPSAMRKTQEASNPSSRGSAKLAEGEKYLYGRGVSTNCKLATSNLEDAAKAGNAKAMAHIGSMYGAGRCVKFDRVKAYEWFAKAKNADPENAWLDSSMDMLWRNMSQKERRAILK